MYDKKETLEYVDLFCARDEFGVLPPEEIPLYDVDTDSWDLWFKVDEMVVDPKDLDLFEGSDSVAIPHSTEEECNSVIEEINKMRSSLKESLTLEKEGS